MSPVVAIQESPIVSTRRLHLARQLRVHVADQSFDHDILSAIDDDRRRRDYATVLNEIRNGYSTHRAPRDEFLASRDVRLLEPGPKACHAFAAGSKREALHRGGGGGGFGRDDSFEYTVRMARFFGPGDPPLLRTDEGDLARETFD